jgi:hypothetical protein
MLNIQQSLGRGIRLIAAGGRRHLPLMTELAGISIIDANPFLKTHVRQRLVDGKWMKHATPEGEPVDQLMEDNVAAYAKYVEARIASLKQPGSFMPGIEPPIPSDGRCMPPVSDLQLSLWPTLRASA